MGGSMIPQSKQQNVSDGSRHLYLSLQKHDVFLVRPDSCVFVINTQQTNCKHYFTHWLNICHAVLSFYVNSKTQIWDWSCKLDCSDRKLNYPEGDLTAGLPALRVCRTNEMTPRSWPACWERAGNKDNQNHRLWRWRSSESWWTRKKSLWRDAYSLQTFLSRLTCSGHRKVSLDTSVFEKLELTGSVRRNSLSTSVSIVVYFGVTVVPFRRKHVVQRVKFCMFVFRQFGFLKARSRLIERRTTCGSDTERWASCCEPSRPLRVIGHPGSLQARAHPSKTCRLSVQNEFNVWGHSTACVMSRLGTAQLCTNMLHDSFQLRVNINWTNLLRSSSDLLSGHDDDLWQTSIKAL